jgi:glycosyltransferase involved in cell wall biosynthesis
MKILWFANTPCCASEKLQQGGGIGGGWLTSLEKLLVEHAHVELSIAFIWGQEIIPFKYNKTYYYPIFRNRSGSKVSRLINRFCNKTDDKKEINRMLKIIDKVNPDVLHIHGTEDNFGLIQAYTKIPVVVSVQGILSAISEKFFAGIPLAVGNKYEGIIPKLLAGSVKRSYGSLLKKAERERAILALTHNILGRTDWDKRITRLLAPNSRYFIGQEALRPVFYTQQWDKTQFGNPIKIVSVVSDSIFKGLETIVNTSRILNENRVLDFEWAVVGLNESSTHARIVKRWLDVDFKKLNIKLIGAVQDTELSSILVQADIFCQTSHIENSPNSLCEAMLVGLPCIASNVGGTDTILENRVEGILVQEGEPYSLAAMILKMVSDLEKAIQYANSARNRALKRHKKEEIASNLISIYNKLISEINVEK